MSQFQVCDLYESLLLKVSSLESNENVSIVVVDGRPKCGKTTVIKSFKKMIEQEQREHRRQQQMSTEPGETLHHQQCKYDANSCCHSERPKPAARSVRRANGRCKDVESEAATCTIPVQELEKELSKYRDEKLDDHDHGGDGCTFLFFTEEHAGNIIESKQTNYAKREIVRKLCDSFWRAISAQYERKTVLVFDRAFDSNLMFVNQPDYTVEQNKHEQALCSLVWVEVMRRFDKVVRIVIDATRDMMESVRRRADRNQPGDSLWNGICNVGNLPDVGHCVYIRSDFEIMNICVLSILKEMNKKYQ